MEPSALRRAFRARPGTEGWFRFAAFLEELESSEMAWRRLVALVERDVVPVVARCHPDVEAEDVSSTCLGGAFETWVPEWLAAVHVVASVSESLVQGRDDEAFADLATHPRFCGDRAREAGALWSARRWNEAVTRVQGTKSARSHFIARARAQIRESQRKQERQSRLMTRHCSDALGMTPSGRHHSLANEAARVHCGAELDRSGGEGATWRISALPPAHLPSHELADRLRRMLEAIEALGPDHARVFKLLVEGLSQRKIARVEGRHPAVISRRVRSLQELCRVQLLE